MTSPLTPGTPGPPHRGRLRPRRLRALVDQRTDARRLPARRRRRRQRAGLRRRARCASTVAADGASDVAGRAGPGAHRRARASSRLRGRLHRHRPSSTGPPAAFEAIIADGARRSGGRQATTSPSPAPTTGSGTRWRSSPSATRRRSSTTTPTTSSRWSRRPGSGPAYQVTSQVNVVRPGGQAQDPHRDYHLGFLSNEVAARYPAHVHLLSPVLTLQGAVAHSRHAGRERPDDVPAVLPPVRARLPRLAAAGVPRATSRERYVQLPLAQGRRRVLQPGAVPRRGTNVSADVQRMANLLQVSSAFGRAMETVDRAKVVTAVYPVLRARRAAGADQAAVANAVAASAEGYPFPTNLDLDQPIGGLTPLAQADIVRRPSPTDGSRRRWRGARRATTAAHRRARSVDR